MKKYLYADESGNMDFRDHTAHRNGPTRYLAMGSLMIEGEDKMQRLRRDIADLRYDLARRGIHHDGHFHATTDEQAIRDEMFELLQGHDFKVDVTLLEKSKALPRIYETEPQFYQYAAYYHFKWFASRYFTVGDELTMVSAGLGTKRTRAAFRKAVESVVAQCCPTGVKSDIAFWNASTEEGLQAVDYVLWAVMRDIERGDTRSRKLIEDKINSVYDLWSIGTKHHYGPLAAS